jgi:hypothetical protein
MSEYDIIAINYRVCRIIIWEYKDIMVSIIAINITNIIRLLDFKVRVFVYKLK